MAADKLKPAAASSIVKFGIQKICELLGVREPTGISVETALGIFEDILCFVVPETKIVVFGKNVTVRVYREYQEEGINNLFGMKIVNILGEAAMDTIVNWAGGKVFNLAVKPRMYVGKGCTAYLSDNLMKRMVFVSYFNVLYKKTARLMAAEAIFNVGIDSGFTALKKSINKQLETTWKNKSNDDPI